MNRVKALARLGWAGLLGAALIVGSAASYLFVIAPEEARLAQLRERASALQARVERQAHGAANGEQGPAAQLKTFYAHFPAKQEAPEALRKIYGAAARYQLDLFQGEYRIVRERETPLARYQVTLPVKGSYTRLRGFAGEVLGQLPFASLDDISIEREAIASPEVEARLRFTLYLGEG
jgi:Tfp pilus assembly protein PilO